jgi:hypothetical protein
MEISPGHDDPAFCVNAVPAPALHGNSRGWAKINT